MSRHRRDGSTKIAYATREAAVRAGEARRRVGKDVRVYRCKWTVPNSSYSVVREEHWHLTSEIPTATPGHRYHEQWNDVLSKRVVGCQWAENAGPASKRLLVLAQRCRKVGGQ